MDDNVVRSKRAMMNAAMSRILIVNSARFGYAALYKLADLAEFDRIITDAPPGPDQRALLDQAGVPLTISDTETPQP